MIKDAESKAYRGLLSGSLSRVLKELQGKCNVTLSAVIKAPKTLSIVVYGQKSESNDVGDILVEHGFYLQLPDSRDTSVRYHNPQSFSLPGFHAKVDLDMPIREPKVSSATKVPVLDSVAQSKVAELLDSASGPEEFREVQASDKLITELKS
jgi:hypothetical protein